MSQQLLNEMIDRYERATFTINKKMHASMKRILPPDLTTEQLSIIRYLIRTKNVTSSELSEVMCVGKSTITSTINRLVNKGYIERCPSQDDRRVVHLHLTKLGIEQYNLIEAEVRAVMGPYLAKVEEKEALEFIAILEKLVNVLQPED